MPTAVVPRASPPPFSRFVSSLNTARSSAFFAFIPLAMLSKSTSRTMFFFIRTTSGTATSLASSAFVMSFRHASSNSSSTTTCAFSDRSALAILFPRSFSTIARVRRRASRSARVRA